MIRHTPVFFIRVAVTAGASLIFAVGEFVVFPIEYPDCFNHGVGLEHPFRHAPCSDVPTRMWVWFFIFIIVVAAASMRFIRARPPSQRS